MHYETTIINIRNNLHLFSARKWINKLWNIHAVKYYSAIRRNELLIVTRTCAWLCVCSVAQLYLTLCDLWTVACQAPLSMGFPRQESRGGLLFSSPGDLPSLGIEPVSPALQADYLPLSHLGHRWNSHTFC